MSHSSIKIVEVNTIRGTKGSGRPGRESGAVRRRTGNKSRASSIGERVLIWNLADQPPAPFYRQVDLHLFVSVLGVLALWTINDARIERHAIQAIQTRAPLAKGLDTGIIRHVDLPNFNVDRFRYLGQDGLFGRLASDDIAHGEDEFARTASGKVVCDLQTET